jgi:hypothetical protein
MFDKQSFRDKISAKEVSGYDVAEVALPAADG